MKRILQSILLGAIALFASNQLVHAQGGEIDGGTWGNVNDILVVNSDESVHDPAIRLQARNFGVYKEWMMYQWRASGDLYWSYWQANSKSNDNENDVGNIRMTLLNEGRLGIKTTSPSYEVHAKGSIYADGGWMRVSGTNGLYFQSYGGGFHMTDNTWVRLYNNKSLYGGTATIRTDGELQVGSGGSKFRVQNDGTTTLGGKMVVQNGTNGGSGKGIHMWTATDTNWGIYMGQSGSGKALDGGTAVGGQGFTSHAIRFRVADSGSQGFVWENSNDELLMSVRGSDGYAYIGGDLLVDDKVTADAVTVATGTFPDYVFAPSYHLMPLREVESYIKANQHLPNVPAANEVIANGMNLGEMNVLLMEKVEELTLYTIEQENRLDAQAAAIAALRAELDALKK